MNDYIKTVFTFENYTETESDILASFLADAGYESFEQEPPTLVAYIKKELYYDNLPNIVLEEFQFNNAIRFDSELIIGQDWNEEWEKNYFQPIIINDRCIIHSTFHKDIPKLEYDIVIDPKMAFGTGHHETTSLMIARLLETDLVSKKVLDMGAGTGILSILASKRGAESVIGIEIDPPAHINALENINLNSAYNVDIKLGDASLLDRIDPYFDLILANINRNIILMDIDKYANVLKSGGYMQLSGFYLDDIPVILETATKFDLKEILHTEKNKWAMLLLQKK